MMHRCCVLLLLVLGACGPSPPEAPASRHVCVPTPMGLAECHPVETAPATPR